MSQETKFTKEEMDRLEEIQKKYANIQLNLGQLGFTKIRLENEICEVTGVLANTITVIRGTHGSTKATHADDVAIRLPFFNNYVDFDKYSTAQTDSLGRFKATNFFGYGRNTDGSNNRESNGIVAGSFSCKFYEAGF